MDPLPQTWVGLRGRHGSACSTIRYPGLPSSRTNTNTGCAWLACRFFQPVRGKLGEVVTQTPRSQ